MGMNILPLIVGIPTSFGLKQKNTEILPLISSPAAEGRIIGKDRADRGKQPRKLAL